jgi:hypothetical protein
MTRLATAGCLALRLAAKTSPSGEFLSGFITPEGTMNLSSPQLQSAKIDFES